MIGQTIREKDDNADYVIGLIDGENYLPYLPTKKGDYPRPYGIPDNAKGLEYLERVEEGDLVLGYKTIMYRKDKEGVEWKDLPRFWCKNNGIIAVFRVESGFRDIRHVKDWFKHHPNWDENYPNTIDLSEPLFFLRNRIVFRDLKTLVPKLEYVKNYRRSVTRFSKTETQKIFDMMKDKNPEITEEINNLF